MAVCAPHARPSRNLKGRAASCRPTGHLRRRSSVVERVIGNDEVLSSILSGGTSFPKILPRAAATLTADDAHVVRFLATKRVKPPGHDRRLNINIRGARFTEPVSYTHLTLPTIYSV